MGAPNIDSSKKTDKIMRMVEYLAALARIDRKTIRDVEKYERVVWLHEIPREPRYCFVQAWGVEDDGGEGAWITVEKFQEPRLPAPPAKCRDWIDRDSLVNSEGIPELRRASSISSEECDQETGEMYEKTESSRLEDFPEIKAIWAEYIEKKWLPWAAVHVRYQAVSNIYSKLFQIYQDQQRLGEQYELLLSLGLLTWLTPTGHKVRRHVLCAAANLEFEARPGKFTLGPSTEGAQVRIEFDMLDPEDQPANVKQLEEGITVLNDSPFDKAAVDPLLAAIAHSLPPLGKGEYNGYRLEPMALDASEKPVVEFAPALILRKRTQRHLENVLSRIKEQLTSNKNIPHGFLGLCEAVENGDGEESGELERRRDARDTQIFFPLPANEEQRRIIRALDVTKEVLVQGPPGTGKSHTIANIICHLLATGRRVLVTAKTPRALKVLHDKLPEEIRPLCVSLLGHGTEERRSMEKSVAGILEKHGAWDKAKVRDKIHGLERDIRENEEARVQSDNQLMGFRERETYKHSVADGVYQGTAAAIARRLNKEEHEFSWFEDHVGSDQVLSLTDEELSWLSQVFELEIDDEAETLSTQYIPDPEHDLPTVEKVRTLFQSVRAAPKKTSAASESLESPAGLVLKQATNDVIEPLKLAVEKLAAEAETLRQRKAPWIRRAVDEILAGNDASWRELLTFSRNESQGLRELAVRMDAHRIEVPHRLPREKLIYEAKIITDHLKGGGKLVGLLWKPRVVKEHGQFLEAVKVDGLPCSDSGTLEILIDYVELEQRLKRVWARWRGKYPQPVESFLIQTSRIEEIHYDLEQVLGLRDLKEKAAEYVARVKGLSGPRWEDHASLLELVEACQAVREHRVRLFISKQLQEMQKVLSAQAASDRAHPITREFLDAFNKRNAEGYSQLMQRAAMLRRRAETVIRKNQLINKLSESVPQLVSNLSQANEPRLWAERLKDLSRAWAWARAKDWLMEFIVTDCESLERNSARLGQEIRDDLAELAAAKAWDFCIDRMKPHHKEHLVAWKKAMDKYGKGKGKFKDVNLQNAQRHLNECREAVPAWIMPLHRVYETVQADAGIFDVVIVDEASQCGPESLPLMYLGEKILIVGDDQQISPEAVGVNKAKVFNLINDFLPDFRHHDSYDKETSLFDHGSIRFGNPISLREHFRCVPEIIYFSNDLCYSASPLIPLRQYPPNRLNPIEVRKVANGYREGAGPRVINRPEAEAVAEAITQCCRDPRYNDLTMGVIVLQGEAQAGIIEDLLIKLIGAEEMVQRRLVCGNPYSFQGDERHVIFLSMVAAPNERIGMLSKKPDVRRFNVAASRARDQMWLFHSEIYNAVSEGCLRRQLLDYFNNPRSRLEKILGDNAEDLRKKALRANRGIERPPAPFDSWFEVDVALDIANRGYRVVPQFEFGGKVIDLVVQGGARQLAVECYGEHWHSGEDNVKADLERQRKLERCGWEFFIVRESFYRASPERALERLWELLAEKGIHPVSFGEEEMSPAQDHVKGEHDSEARPSEEKIEYTNGESDSQSDQGREPDKNSTDEPLSKEFPHAIQDALRVRRNVIEREIILVLRERPNNTCKKDDVPALILNRWSINTRGNPRRQFAKKIEDAINNMDRIGYVQVYKATNIRIRLGCVPYPGLEDPG